MARNFKNPLDGFERKLEKEVETALVKAGKLLERESKRRVPVDTGVLQRSISWVITKFTGGIKLIFGSGAKAGLVKYAEYVEYGTPKMQGIPFLRSTLSDKKAKIERLIAAAVRRSFK